MLDLSPRVSSDDDGHGRQQLAAPLRMVMSVATLTRSERILGLIPAKGGSIRLPRKNVLPLGGRPLIAWTIDAARASGVVDRLVVSTEDPEVADVARAYGAEPLRRPDHLARDPAGVVDVALHALDALEAEGDRFDTIVILLPTCPFRTPEDIRAAHRLHRDRPDAFIMSVSPFSHPPFAAFGLDEVGLLKPHFPEYIGRKSQEMPAAYRPNGAVHVLGAARFRQLRSYFAPPLVPYVMPVERSIDIDSAADMREAELRLKMEGGPAWQ